MFLLDFFEFLSTKFAACLKPPGRDNNHVKRLILGRNNVTSLCLLSDCKNDAFTGSAMQLTNLTNFSWHFSVSKCILTVLMLLNSFQH